MNIIYLVTHFKTLLLTINNKSLVNLKLTGGRQPGTKKRVKRQGRRSVL